jgi:hypothetical protein
LLLLVLLIFLLLKMLQVLLLLLVFGIVKQFLSERVQIALLLLDVVIIVLRVFRIGSFRIVSTVADFDPIIIDVVRVLVRIAVVRVI